MSFDTTPEEDAEDAAARDAAAAAALAAAPEHLTCENEPHECLCPDIVNPEREEAKRLQLGSPWSKRGLVAEAVATVSAEPADTTPAARLEAVLTLMRQAPWLPPARLLAHVALWAVEIDSIREDLCDWHKADDCPEDEDEVEYATEDAAVLAAKVAEYGATWVDVMSLRALVQTDAAMAGIERAGHSVPLDPKHRPIPPGGAPKRPLRAAASEGLL